MYPFTKNIDYLQLESQWTNESEGENYINIRTEWHNLDDITRDDMFTSINSGLTVSGEWVVDGGDESADSSVREKRAYCRKGKATFTFTGSSISVRIYANPLYGTADVRIDGVLPSTLANVTQATDIIDTDAYNIDDTWGQEYLDITLASNISDAEHTVELYAENAGSGIGDWFVITGYKVHEFDNKTRDHDCWITSTKIPGNKEELSFWNRCDGYIEDIYNFEAIFGAYFVDANGNAMGTVTETQIEKDDRKLITFYPNVQGAEQEQTVQDTIQITCEYEDPDGAIERNFGLATLYWNDVDFITYDEHWDLEYSSFVAWTNVHLAEFTLEFYGNSIEIWFKKWPDNGGHCKFWVDDVYINLFSCTTGGKFIYITSDSWSGFGVGRHMLKIVADCGNNEYVGVHAFQWSDVRYYTEVVETLTYDYNLYQIPPFAPENPRFLDYGDKNPTCDEVNTGMVDLSIPRDNAGVSGLWLEKRPATFAVCYQSGFEDILKTYDIVIVEPKALTRTIVKEYQDLGIKVLCYQAYGEEVGTYENEWDNTSSIVPFTGDGEGAGGYASYYNKGGNQFGECSECKHDRRRLEDVTLCALEQTSYYAAWAGRCSNACTKDWRTGYENFSIGGSCGGGHNSGTYWSRTATKACTNSDCPDYNPVHGACQFYEPPDDAMYGQDYSIFTPDWPDENGIWKSFYTNPVEQSWNDRIKDHCLSVIFDEGIEYTKTVKVNTYATSDASITVDGFKVANVPIDSDEDVTVIHAAENFTYVRGQDYIFDVDLGTFKMQVSSDGAPGAPWGTELSVTYTRKGLQADGVFLDTLDTVDVYTSDAYREAMVSMIAEHHRLYPDKLWAMNRGFTILENLMPFTDFVMFESFITTINWDTGAYYEITNPAAIAANQVFIDLLFELRKIYTFNVLGLNYCDDDDDALKQTIAEKVRAYGWLSWSSTISLNDPQENTEIFTKDLYIESNAWRLTDELDLP